MIVTITRNDGKAQVITNAISYEFTNRFFLVEGEKRTYYTRVKNIISIDIQYGDKDENS